jgi:hypothetical protein
VSGVDPEEFSFVKIVLNGLVEELVRRGHQVPRTVPRAREILERAMVSQLRQSEADDAPEWFEDNAIGTGEAAKLLGCDRKTLQRRPGDFGGRMVAGRWVFDRTELGA